MYRVAGVDHLVVAAEAFPEVGVGRPVLELVHDAVLIVLLVLLEEGALLHHCHIPVLAVDHLHRISIRLAVLVLQTQKKVKSTLATAV